MMEHGVICDGNLIISPETQRKLVIKSVHDDIHGGYTKRDEIRSMVAGIFSKCRRINKKMQKNVKN